MWLMIFIGTILAAGFVFALRSQINAHQLGLAEEQLRARLDEYSSQQKFLQLNQERALSMGESDRASKQAGLSQLRLKEPNVLRSASAPRASTPALQKVSMPVRPAQVRERNQSAKMKKVSGGRRQTSRSHQKR